MTRSIRSLEPSRAANAASSDVEPPLDDVSTLEPLTLNPTGPEGAPSGDAARAASPPKEPLGSPIRLGHYVLLHEVGRGGMGVVYAAYDERLERKVALKLLRAQGDAAAARRLTREAQGLARLSHPNVVQIYEIGAIEGQAFLAMEFIDGITLRAWRAERPRSRAAIIALFMAAGRGLEAAHEKGLVHRDFKPDNVMICRDGRVLITDFGLVRRGEGAEPLSPPPASADARADQTQIGAIVGTPGYMPPEQFCGRETDARGDQFSFCVTLWEALCGQRPFAGASRSDVEEAALAGRIAEPPRGALPTWLRETLARGLACEPSDRFPTMAPLLASIERDPTPRRRAVIAVSSLVLLLIAGSGFVVASRAREREATIAACAAGGKALEADWNETIASATERAFVATGVETAASDFAHARPWMDAYAREWSALSTRVCREARVEHTRDEASRSAIAACLDERRAAFEGVLELWAEIDRSKLRMAAAQAAGLPPLSLCTDEAHLARMVRPPEAIRREVTALRSRLERIKALRLAGDAKGALARSDVLLPDALKVGFSPLNAEVRLEIGFDQADLGQYDRSRVSVEQSFVDAASAGDELGMLYAATKQSHTVGALIGQFEQGHSWGRIALAVLSHLNMQGSVAEASLRNSVGSIYLGEDAFGPALAEYARSLAIYEEKLGPQHPNTATSLNNIGSALRGQHKYTESLEPYKRALQIRETALGPDHPAVAYPLTGLGLSYMALGDTEKARASFERAVSIRERAGEPAKLANSQFGLAKVLWSTGDRDRALALALSARDAYRAVGKGTEGDLARVEGWLREHAP